MTLAQNIVIRVAGRVRLRLANVPDAPAELMFAPAKQYAVWFGHLLLASFNVGLLVLIGCFKPSLRKFMAAQT